MFQKIRKNGALIILVFAASLLAGCGDKKESGKAVNNKTEAENISVATTPDLPKATGKVSDTISALETSISAEDLIIAEDEVSAKNAVTDEQETSDFNQVYNESEF